MRRISLILPLPNAESLPEAWVDRCREVLEADGSTLEVVAALPPGETLPAASYHDDLVWTQAETPGLVASAMQGLIESDGEFRIVVDGAEGYVPDHLVRMLVPLKSGQADLVIAGRAPSGNLVDRLIAKGFKALLGASDPHAGLVAMTSEKAGEVAGRFEPVGSRLTIDLLLRLTSRKAEVIVRNDEPSPSFRVVWNDLRHIKRLADDHYGDLSRLIQFCFVGASGMVVDLSCYAALQWFLAKTALATWKTPGLESSLDLTVSAALAIAIALTWNFSLNRRFTFSDARSGSRLRQFLYYALSNALGIALSFTLRLYLPAHVDFFARHRLAAAVVGIVAATGISFSMARWVVFRRRNRVDERGVSALSRPSTPIAKSTLV